MPDLAMSLALHGVLLFVVACVQGFLIPVAASPRLALTAHSKAVIHAAALALCAVSVLSGAVVLGPTASRIALALLAGGAWLSLIGDVWASHQGRGSHLPLAAQAAGQPCDPAEQDYAVPKPSRRPAAGKPLVSTMLVKASAVLMLAGGLVLLYGAGWSLLLI
ncbi:MAG: hypothetical protein ACKOED_10300 [Aestuariivirga sp.]|uniref:hypothetical protein n=1 Tax=Aestuariivirga sp. TaxID=2650926 RepID=UPI0038D1F286